MSDESEYLLVSKFRQEGFTDRKSFVTPELLKRLQEQCLQRLSTSARGAVDSSVNLWAPATDTGDSPATSLFLDKTLHDCVMSCLGRDFFGVMVDFYQLYGRHDMHSDAQHFELAGLRLNVAIDPLLPGRGALRFVSGSNSADVWQHLAAARARGETITAERFVPLSPGDAVFFDLRTWHEVADCPVPRKMLSAFFYAVPKSELEVEAVRASARRNRKAPKAFEVGRGLYSDAFLDVLPVAWRAHLQRFGFID
jgi:hypothetical protein